MISFGRFGSAALSSSSRWPTSLCRQICFSQAGLAHALDHGIVVERVRQDAGSSGSSLRDGRDAGLVGDVAGGEHQRGRLADAGRRARAQARPADGWCRRCCGCRRRRCPCGRRSRPWRRPLWGAGPCRDSRWSTRSRPRAGLAGNARWRAESDRRCARGRQTRGSGVLASGDPGQTRKYCCNPCDFSTLPRPTRSFFKRLPGHLSRQHLSYFAAMP